MSDPVRLDLGANVAYDIVDRDGENNTDVGLGGDVNLGLGFSLNPRDQVAFTILARGTGLFHGSDDLRFIAVNPELGMGVFGKRWLGSVSGGPLLSGNQSGIGGSGQLEMGYKMNEHSAIVWGFRYALLPKVGTNKELKTEVVIDDTTGDYDVVTREAVTDVDAHVFRSYLGFRGMFNLF